MIDALPRAKSRADTPYETSLLRFKRFIIIIHRDILKKTRVFNKRYF